MTIEKYKPREFEVYALQYDPEVTTHEEIKNLVGECEIFGYRFSTIDDPEPLQINTPNYGNWVLSKGNFLVKDENSEIHVWQKEEFLNMYEKVPTPVTKYKQNDEIMIIADEELVSGYISYVNETDYEITYFYKGFRSITVNTAEFDANYNPETARLKIQVGVMYG